MVYFFLCTSMGVVENKPKQGHVPFHHSHSSLCDRRWFYLFVNTLCYSMFIITVEHACHVLVDRSPKKHFLYCHPAMLPCYEIQNSDGMFQQFPNSDTLRYLAVGEKEYEDFGAFRL